MTTIHHIKIDWSEIDLYGHVNNVAVMKYMQSARINFCEAAGINRLYLENKIGFMVVATNCQFKRPLFFPGNIRIETQVEQVKTTSFILNHQIYDDFENISAMGQDVLVMYDFNLFGKTEIPVDIKQKMKV
jgi:acyl-CoA thioester hydrolase